MQKARKWADDTRKWRWPAAFAFAIVAILLAAFASYSHIGAVCKDAVTAARTVHLCAPPSLGDFVLLFIPALLFLLPDMSELNVLGVSLKRVEEKVDDAEGQATEHAATLAAADNEVLARLTGLEQRTDGNAEALRTALENNARTALESIAQLERRLKGLERLGDPRDRGQEPLE
jgi:hypothetical protein